MNLENYDIISDQLNSLSRTLPKRKHYWNKFKNKILRIIRYASEYLSIVKDEYNTYESKKIYKYSRQYNSLNLYEVERDTKLLNENQWILEQCKKHIGPLPERKPEESIKRALNILHRQRLFIAPDRLYYKTPKVQPPPNIPTVWNAPRAIVCRCPKHECRCVMRKTTMTVNRDIPKGKRFRHIPFTKVKPPPGLILTTLASRISEATERYNSAAGEKDVKKLGVEFCMAGCLNYIATCFMVDAKDRNALKELQRVHKIVKKRKKQVDDKPPKKKKGKKAKAKEQQAALAEPVAAVDAGAKTAATDGELEMIPADRELEPVPVEEEADVSGTEGETAAKVETIPKEKEQIQEYEPNIIVPKEFVICNMFYNTVATQTERDANNELIIGEYLHVIFACPEDTTLCDIEGMKVEIKPYDHTDSHESNIQKLFHVNELKEHISKIKTVLYDPLFEIVQDKLIKRSNSSGVASLEDFFKSIDDVTKKCSCALEDDEEFGVKAEIYLPWMSLEKLSHLRDSFLKYIRGDIDEGDARKYVDVVPDTRKGCLPPDRINDEPTEGKTSELESDPAECSSTCKEYEKANICKGDIPFKVNNEESVKKDEANSCKSFSSSDTKPPLESLDIKTDNELDEKDNVNRNSFEKTDDHNKKTNKRFSVFEKRSSNQSNVNKPKNGSKTTGKTENDVKMLASGSEIKKVPSEKKSSAKFSVSFGEFKEKIFQRDPWRPCIPTESEIEYKKELKKRRAKKTGLTCECEEDEEDTCWKSKKSVVYSESKVRENSSYESTRGILKKSSIIKSGSKEFEDNKVVSYCSDVMGLKNSSELEMISHNMDNNMSSGGTSLFSSSKTLMRLTFHKLKIW